MPGCFRQRCARSEDIVDQNQRGTRKSERGTVSRSEFRVPRSERPRHIRQTRLRCQRRLRRRSEEHTSELQSRRDLVCRLLLEKKKKQIYHHSLLKQKKKKKK